MITKENEVTLQNILMESVPVLFLGAGFSIGSKSSNDLLDGKDLKKLILEELIKDKVDESDYEEIQTYDLRKLCDEVYSIYDGKNELYKLLTDCFKNTRLGKTGFHSMIVEYPWREIYTVNIDDLVEYIYKKSNKDLFVQNKKSLSQEPDHGTILYKLHGCVNNPSDGYIFSDSEYTGLISKKLDSKLNRFADAMQNRNVIFVGAQMDEPDIKYYLDVYESAGCKYRTNRIVFINPKPNRYLKTLAKRLNAELIEATAEEFLRYVKNLNYNPDELRKSIIRLNYDGVHRLTDLIETFEKPYESKLYYGDFCKWQDAADEWIVETDSYSEAKEKLNRLIELDEPVSCFSIYGPMFSGKSCMLKTMGLYLASLDYDVLEYIGKRLNRSSIINYITHTSRNKIAILIDNGSYYYEQIESFFLKPIEGKHVLILTGAREYYHKRKKYYLEGNSYSDYKLSPYFSDNDPQVIMTKLDSKSHLSYMASMQDKDRIAEIKRKQNIVNLIVALTYGKVVRGKMFLPSHGKEFFTSYGKHFFT